MIRSIWQPSANATTPYRFPRQARPVRLIAVYIEFTSNDANIRPVLDYEFAGIAPIAELHIVTSIPPVGDNVGTWGRSLDTVAAANGPGTIGSYTTPLLDILITDQVTVTLNALDPDPLDSFGVVHWVFDDLQRE